LRFILNSSSRVRDFVNARHGEAVVGAIGDVVYGWVSSKVMQRSEVGQGVER
jgi:hypothetical protein